MTVEHEAAVDARFAALPGRPGKIVAVHLSYASRADQRGRRPAHPSYFLKPSSSVAASGGVVERPEGTELLAFEGEIALIIGTPARRVPIASAWDHVAAVTAANDFGLYDLRANDKGSNARSKGGDGFTPLGPGAIDARAVDPATLRVRTWVNGVLAQDDTAAGMIFPLARLVADLSQHFTLETGDVILTGTPAGSSVVVPGDIVEVEVDVPGGPSSGRLVTTITQGESGFDEALGSLPTVDDTQRAEAWGSREAAGLPEVTPVLTDELREKLVRAPVAGLSQQLRKRGLDNVSIDGVSALRSGCKMVGAARTLRFVPNREDLFGSHGGGYNAQKRTFDTVAPGEVIVIEARGETGSGTLGDILALRATVLGAAGVVTDGGVRDHDAVADIGLPVFAAGAHPAVLGRRHVPWDSGITIACGGATVQPGDIIVGDSDGVIVIPPTLAEEVADAALAQEDQDAWVAEQVTAGHPIDGLFPPNAEWKARYLERRAGIGAGAREHRAPHRDRGAAGRDRTGGTASPHRDARGLSGARTSRRNFRPPGSLASGIGVTMTQTVKDDVAQRIPADLPERIRHYIGGEFVDSVGGDTFEVLDPVSNEAYVRAAAGKKADIDLAVAAARIAFAEGPWPRMLPRERSRVLYRIADIVESRDARLAELESFDSGLPIAQALGQARRAAENFRFFADLIVAQADDTYKVPGRQINYVNRKPIGVAGLITPWNTPFMLESWKLAPALATGNTVVLKPAEFTPLSASLWAGIFAEAGLPEGVFNLVNGLGEEAGDALVKHPEVPLISFTGESRTGQIIFGNAAPHLKHLSMELGGKSPAIVFADADLDAAIDATVFGVFSLNGERCTAGSRILVERSVYDEFVERYAAQAKRVVVGYPHDPETEVGTLVHPEHFEKVMHYIEIGKSEGRLVAGGGRPEGFDTGNFVAPTVFADVEPQARIFQEEIFGPVVAITPFDSDEEALALANGVKYGLAAYVWTNDLKRAHNVAQSIEAGMVWLNSNNVRDLRTPFGGVKASGLGHEGGYRSIAFYTDEQAVHITLGKVHNPTFGKQE